MTASTTADEHVPGDARQAEPVHTMDTISALERAARQLFVSRGHDGTHIADIAATAGVSISTFYARLGSKAGAYQRVMGVPPPEAPTSRLTPRAQRTRDALVAAARIVIEREGFHAARIVDIATAAGSSTGSFYSYFTSKQQIFEAVMQVAIEELQMRPHDVATGPPDTGNPAGDIRERIRRSVAHYLDHYTSHSRLLLRLDEAAASHPELTELRLAIHDFFARRIARSIRRWQSLDLIDRQLDPDHAADALGAMVGHASRVWLTYGKPHDHDTAVDTLTRLWIGGLKLHGRPLSTDVDEDANEEGQQMTTCSPVTGRHGEVAP